MPELCAESACNNVALGEREKGIALLYIVKAAAFAHGTVVKAAAAAAARVLSFLQQH